MVRSALSWSTVDELRVDDSSFGRCQGACKHALTVSQSPPPSPPRLGCFHASYLDGKYVVTRTSGGVDVGSSDGAIAGFPKIARCKQSSGCRDAKKAPKRQAGEALEPH